MTITKKVLRWFSPILITVHITVVLSQEESRCTDYEYSYFAEQTNDTVHDTCLEKPKDCLLLWSESHPNIALSHINLARQTLASNAPAGNMRKMIWDWELAAISHYRCSTCKVAQITAAEPWQYGNLHHEHIGAFYLDLKSCSEKDLLQLHLVSQLNDEINELTSPLSSVRCLTAEHFNSTCRLFNAVSWKIGGSCCSYQNDTKHEPSCFCLFLFNQPVISPKTVLYSAGKTCSACERIFSTSTGVSQFSDYSVPRAMSSMLNNSFLSHFQWQCGRLSGVDDALCQPPQQDNNNGFSDVIGRLLNLTPHDAFTVTMFVIGLCVAIGIIFGIVCVISQISFARIWRDRSHQVVQIPPIGDDYTGADIPSLNPSRSRGLSSRFNRSPVSHGDPLHYQRLRHQTVPLYSQYESIWDKNEVRKNDVFNKRRLSMKRHQDFRFEPHQSRTPSPIRRRTSVSPLPEGYRATYSRKKPYNANRGQRSRYTVVASPYGHQIYAEKQRLYQEDPHFSQRKQQLPYQLNQSVSLPDFQRGLYDIPHFNSPMGSDSCYQEQNLSFCTEHKPYQNELMHAHSDDSNVSQMYLTNNKEYLGHERY